MISREEIQKLAELARIKLSDEEMASLQKDFDSILDYVGQIQKMQLSESSSSESRAPINIMREDEPRAADNALAGKKEAILAQAPKREDDYFVVRKIIDRDS